MTKAVDFYFTPISPWTYLGTPTLRAVAARTGATVRFKPVDIMQLFATANVKPVGQRPEPIHTPLVELDAPLLHLVRFSCLCRERRVVVLERIGLNAGDVIFEGENLYGDVVNTAARLQAEGTVPTGFLCITTTEACSMVFM